MKNKLKYYIIVNCNNTQETDILTKQELEDFIKQNNINDTDRIYELVPKKHLIQQSFKLILE